MLAAANRLGDAASFREVTRQGRRAASRSLVVYVQVGRTPDTERATSDQPMIGLVVSRAIGNAVVRTRVKRRLRHLMRERVALLPPCSRVVVRALPGAAQLSSAALSQELEQCMGRALTKALATAGDGS
ncbi:ribonuclease P protein component [soil metagenome]